MGQCGGVGRLPSCFTQFCAYFQATVPSECHMKNIFSLGNYPFKCEAHLSIQGKLSAYEMDADSNLTVKITG